MKKVLVAAAMALTILSIHVPARAAVEAYLITQSPGDEPTARLPSFPNPLPQQVTWLAGSILKQPIDPALPEVFRAPVSLGAGGITYEEESCLSGLAFGVNGIQIGGFTYTIVYVRVGAMAAVVLKGADPASTARTIVGTVVFEPEEAPVAFIVRCQTAGFAGPALTVRFIVVAAVETVA